MEFENITVTKQGVTKIDTVTIIIPLQFSINKNIKITSTDRELIHIAINNHALLHDYSKNIDFVFDRILTILLKSNEVSMDDKCLFEDWNLQAITFKNWTGKKCNAKEKKVFYSFKSDKIFERINGNKNTTWRDYMNMISLDPSVKAESIINNISGVNKP
tara:strand:+ start:240 stop:719 length:480 start_codon:yes stop_codon:yes gene_type:complete